MRKRKRIEEFEFEYFKMYMQTKLEIESERIKYFKSNEDVDAIKARFYTAINSDLEAVNIWFQDDISSAQAKKFWTALRGYAWSKRHPTNDRVVQLDIARALLEYTGKDCLNLALVSLLPEGLIEGEIVSTLENRSETRRKLGIKF